MFDWIMANLDWAIGFCASTLTLAGGLITIIVKFIKAVKEKNLAVAKTALQEGAEYATQAAEDLKVMANGNLTADTKKQIAMTKLNQYCIDHKIKFEETSASEAIERVVELTKNVNARDKDKLAKAEEAKRNAI